jgi:hypothetical protein
LVAVSVTARAGGGARVDELLPVAADEAEPAAGVGRGALKDEDEDVRGEVRAVVRDRRRLVCTYYARSISPRAPVYMCVWVYTVWWRFN